MKTLKYITLAALAITIVSCSKPDNKGTVGESGNDSTQDARIYPVRTHKIEMQTIPNNLKKNANLIAFKEVNYAPVSPGRIEKIHVEVGDKVAKGQVIAEMDKTQLSQAITQYNTAKSAFQRIDTLFKLGSISEQQYETVKSQYELAELNLNFLKEDVNLVSPINGLVTGKYFESKEMYSGVPNTAAGKAALVTLMQINPLKALVSVSQRYFPELKEGMKVTASTDVLPGRTFEGSIYEKYPVIDPATRTFQVEIIIQNPTEELRPGMFADMIINLGNKEAMVVPAIAVLKQEGTNNRYIFINDNGVAKQMEVKLGKRFDELIELEANEVKPGMELVVEGQANLVNGSKIKVVE